MHRFRSFLIGGLLCLSSLCMAAPEAKTHTPFVVISPPKCGTHLIGKVLELMLGKPAHYYLTELGSQKQALASVHAIAEQNGFMVAHNFQRKTLKALVDNGYKIIFILRDPRDQLISIMHWFRRGEWVWVKAGSIQNIEEQVTELITGQRFGWRGYENCLMNYMQKVKGFKPRVLFETRFESLVGPHGQGSQENQTEEILRLARFLKVKLSKDGAVSIGQQIFGHTRTFREGKIGSWKEYFSPEHKELYKNRYAGILIELGYEKDTNW